jgi:hypothetical protein
MYPSVPTNEMSHEFVAMEKGEPVGEARAEVGDFRHGEANVGLRDGLEGAWAVRGRAGGAVCGITGVDEWIGQFHHIVKPAPFLVSACLQDIDQRVMLAGDGFKPFDAVKLPFEGLRVVEAIAPHDFDRAPGAQGRSGQPDLSISAPADAFIETMIGDQGWRVYSGSRCGLTGHGGDLSAGSGCLR